MKFDKTKSYFLNGDCMEVMGGCPDNFFDLAVVDPPYGIGINHNIGRRKGDKGSNHNNIKWDTIAPTYKYFKELFRCSK